MLSLRMPNTIVLSTPHDCPFHSHSGDIARAKVLSTAQRAEIRRAGLLRSLKPVHPRLLRPLRRCRTSRPDLGERWPSRLVAAAAEDSLIIRRNAHVVCGERLPNDLYLWVHALKNHDSVLARSLQGVPFPLLRCGMRARRPGFRVARSVFCRSASAGSNVTAPPATKRGWNLP